MALHFGQTLEHYAGAHEALGIECGRALYGDVALDAASDASLCAHQCAVADGDMACNAHLTAKHTPFAHLRGTGHANLCRHDSVAIHIAVVGNLYEVVQFHTGTDVGAAHRGAVHTGIGADFHIVFDGDDTNLGYFLVALCAGRKAKAIGTYDAT